MFGFQPFSTVPFSTAGASTPVTVSVTGVTAQALLGSTFESLGTVVPVTGLQATMSLGTAIANGTAFIVVDVTGLDASALLSSVLLWSEIPINQTPNWVSIDDLNCVCD
jgi:hypothetical protein